MSAKCRGGDETGVDWVNGLVLHSNDHAWHPWDPSVYEPEEKR